MDLRGSSEVVPAETRVSCMVIIKSEGVIKGFRAVKNNVPTSCHSGPASCEATSSK